MSLRSQDILWSPTGALLPAAARATAGVYRPHLTPLRLTHPQFLVLLVLGLGQPRSVVEIGQLLALSPGTMTPMLKRLELLGFISRSRDAANERRLSVALTNAGIALIPELQQIHARVKQVIGLNSVDQQLLQEFVASIPVAPTAV